MNGDTKAEKYNQILLFCHLTEVLKALNMTLVPYIPILIIFGNFNVFGTFNVFPITQPAITCSKLTLNIFHTF